MELIDRIQDRAKRLPKRRQQEVLDFVDFLLAQSIDQTQRESELAVSRLLLGEELQRAEAEEADDAPVYTLAEIRATYS